MDDERRDEQDRARTLEVAQFSLFGFERRTRIILLAFALVNIGLLALVVGYLFTLSWDPYSPARFLW
ncbi:hypothetical protein [Microvirga sp. CF3016]|uniref:hypothetical protein n=1 Tax=Microvirga sp. CF3016 TaxID=3110181 RepID=UPI002E79601A|nr:hypothetical protein [Microvirga sp. CF3016]MEE1611107.1 hypothetical protein [Microvirga sp. CF3016]